MKICVFCGKKGGSKEHISAQWQIKRMDAAKHPIIVAHRTASKVTFRPAHLLNTYTTKDVCGTCNNGWMSDLEGWFQSNLGCLVEPTWPKLADTMLELALKESDRLAKWALKTAICVGNSSLVASVIKPYIAADLFAGKIPSDLHVQIAHMRESGIGCQATHVLRMRNGGAPPQWQTRNDREAFNVVLQLNHFAIRIFRCPGAKASYLAFHGDLPFMVFPMKETSRRSNFSYSNIEDLDRSLEFETWEEIEGRK